jgi:hypothetical protein
MKSKKSKGKDSAPDLAFGNAFSDGYVWTFTSPVSYSHIVLH